MSRIIVRSETFQTTLVHNNHHKFIFTWYKQLVNEIYYDKFETGYFPSPDAAGI